jgi:hypothetical protein
MEDVGLRLVQGDRRWVLDVADAGTADDNKAGWVIWTFVLPADAKAGSAKLLPEDAEPVPVRIR